MMIRMIAATQHTTTARRREVSEEVKREHRETHREPPRLQQPKVRSSARRGRSPRLLAKLGLGTPCQYENGISAAALCTARTQRTHPSGSARVLKAIAFAERENARRLNRYDGRCSISVFSGLFDVRSSQLVFGFVQSGSRRRTRGLRRASSEESSQKAGDGRLLLGANVIKQGRAYLAAGTCRAWREQRGGSHARQGPQLWTTWQAKRSVWLAEQPTAVPTSTNFGTACFGSPLASDKPLTRA